MDRNVAVDQPRENRPGVPREKTPPRAVAHAPAPTTRAAHARAEVLVDPTLPRMPAVHGVPRGLRGASGALRRAAYRLPDYRVRRWMLLLVADRVEAQGDRLRRLLGPRAAAALGLVALAATAGLALAARR
jgi:hypothetical protein